MQDEQEHSALYTTTLVCRKNKICATVNNGQLGLFQSSIKINITIIQDLLNGIQFIQKYIYNLM